MEFDPSGNSLLSRTMFQGFLFYDAVTRRGQPWPAVAHFLPESQRLVPSCCRSALGPQSALRVRARARAAPLPCDRGKIPNTSKQKSSVRPCQVFKPQKPGGGFFSAAARSAEAVLGEDHPGRPSLPARAGKTRENVRRVSTWASRAPAARWVRGWKVRSHGGRVRAAGGQGGRWGFSPTGGGAWREAGLEPGGR